MSDRTLFELADAIEAALSIDDDLARAALQAIAKIDAPHADAFMGPDLDLTDRIMRLVYHALPGWTVSVKGKAWEPNGHWVCSLRKTSSRDSDEFIGVGRGPTLPHSLLAALFRAVGHQS
ncbi:MAG: hypothetical protein QNJ13_07165 [Paracoccaceae bacterium]|nr:hypothetical protein [Paracoccaceae bacterium]